MMRTLSIGVAVAAAVAVAPVAAQPPASDSLTAADAVRLTLANHPLLQQAECGLEAAIARAGVSRAGRYPDVSVTGDYVRLGPVATFELPQETIDLYPANNLDLHVGLRQTLYDFGRVDAGVGLANAARHTAADQVEAIRSSLAYQTVDVFDRILIIRESIRVLDEEIAALGEHMAIGASRIRAGAATDFDTLTTSVRIAEARNRRTDALQALDTQQMVFRRLTGLPPDRPILLRGALVPRGGALDADSLLAAAREQRPELRLAHDAEQSAIAQARIAGLGNRPSLAMSLTSGCKNGYVPNLNTLKGNYTAGLQLDVPVFEGRRTHFQEEEADANLRAARAHTSDVERQVVAEVGQALVGVRSNREKIRSTEVQIRQAERALALARIRYEAGVATNLEVLDAQTALAEAKLTRLRAFYDCIVNLTALDQATGKTIW
jgi:outer membrane protein TolC